MKLKLLFSLLVIGVLASCVNRNAPDELYNLRADTLKVYNPDGKGAELQLENSTKKVVNGLLTNTDTNGLTQFRKLDLVNVGTTGLGIVGQDTITLDKLQYYLPITGGNVTGNLSIQSAVANKHLIAMNLGNNSSAGNSTFGPSAYYLGLGHREWGVGTLRLMGFGFRYTTNDHYPVVIGYQETSGTSSTMGDFNIWTRPVTTNTAALLRFKIAAAGNVKSYGPITAAEDVATKGYVDTAYKPVKTISTNGAISVVETPNGTMITNNASAATTYTLPPAKPGAFYEFWKVGSSVMTIVGPIADVNNIGTKIVSGTETSTSITMKCNGANWVVLSKNGTWTAQ